MYFNLFALIENIKITIKNNKKIRKLIQYRLSYITTGAGWPNLTILFLPLLLVKILWAGGHNLQQATPKLGLRYVSAF